MTRVREESVHFGTRPGILRGLAVTGGVITSAGVVLAATFTVLRVLPLVFLAGTEHPTSDRRTRWSGRCRRTRPKALAAL